MYFVNAPLAAVLLAARLTVADFLIFCGAENQLPDPASSLTVSFFNNPPDCDDFVNSVGWTPQFYNDASHGGIACDGCTAAKAASDWDVTRLEVYDNDGKYFDNGGDAPHFTLYKDEENGGWGMYDVDMILIGTCERPDPVQIITCQAVLSVENAAGIIHFDIGMASSLIDELTTNGKVYLDNGDDEARKKVIAAASELILTLENPGEIMARIGWGEPTRTAALRTAFELGLLEKLGDKPLGSEILAAGTKADPTLVARTLKHLAANGLVKEVGKDFDHGPVQHGLKTDKPFFAILQSNPRLGSAFNNFMAGYAKARPRWVDIYPVEERLGTKTELSTNVGPLLVDVGGGLGHELSAFHASNGSNLPGQLVLQDLPSVIDQAKGSSDLPTSIKAVAHDFFEPQPTEYRGARAYFMRLVLHDWPDAKCAVILSHLRDAMAKGHSKLLINEAVLQDTGAPWQQTSLDWTMMGMLVSRERTESQWGELLAQAGLKISGIWRKDSESVIEAVLDSDNE
ncbi:hypothetical protein G7Z17_g3064 [Cylindrodendrum hubeiense]|uniref:O-methyltransferase C-terminal domain-containing protein n=1 Tax=Cylindrodendrum hubeiense TaxID=595255 RepID=A0A9P5HBL5_9HYPO|nr:hypothetical protein G7Z17_g3064 [Cylindrodendrum hubeiense]